MQLRASSILALFLILTLARPLEPQAVGAEAVRADDSGV
jgi:hypothetical protein